MAKNVESLERRFEVVTSVHEESHHDDGQDEGNSDTDNSPVPSSTFSDFNDASSKAETDILPSWTNSWSSPPDNVNNTARIADPQGDVHPDWIIPSSPPSPPLRYDPRCRASSPETPSPLYGRWQKPGARKEAGKSSLSSTEQASSHSSTNSSAQFSSTAGSAPVSRASSWLSASDYSSASSTTSCQPSASILLHASFVGASSASPLINPLHVLSSHQRPSQDHSQPYASTSYAPPPRQPAPPLEKQATRLDNQSGIYNTHQDRSFPVLQPGVVPAWRHEVSRAAGQSYSTAIGARPRTGLAKLSRFREPTSSGKKRVILPAKHAHKRSCSVQWQQSERWQKKSRARLRDLLVLLVLMLTGTVMIWKLCFGSSGPSETQRRQPLKLPYLATLPEPQRDTMIIYRVLGNDLSPRHEVGQTLRNLRFMLSHENDFSQFSSPEFSPYNLKIEKYYVLNRITNATAVQTIMSLFEEFGVPESRILNIPFDIQEYRKQEMRWDGGVAIGKNQWGIGAPGIQNITGQIEYLADSVIPDTPERKEKRLKRDLLIKLRAMEYATHDKNLYAINNNGGRNFALEHGRSLPNARWLFPLDGNCFLTPPAMAALVQTMASSAEGEGSKRHVIVPMARLLDNRHVLADNEAPWLSKEVQLQDLEIDLADAPEEPQVGFRWDSPVSYQPAMRYGRRSKLELLWRLGAIPFARGLHIKRLPWEKQDYLYITPHSYASAVTASVSQEQTSFGISDGDFAKAGWVHRLFSGDTSQEHSTKQAAELRRLNRMRGIVAYLEDLDVKAGINKHNSTQIPLEDRLWHWDTQALQELKTDIGQKKTSSTGLNNFLKSSTDLMHRLSNSLRWAAGTNLAGTRARDISDEALRLAAAGYLSDNPQYIQNAVKAMMAILPNPSIPAYQTTLSIGQPSAGYAFPSLPHPLSDSQYSIGLPYNPFTFSVTPILDIARLVRMSGQTSSLSATQKRWINDLDQAFVRHLRILLLSDDALALSRSPRSAELAIHYDSTIAALSAYLGFPTLLSRVQNRHHLRYIQPETGDLGNSINVHNEASYKAFTSGLKNVALDNEPAGLDTQRILEELVLSM